MNEIDVLYGVLANAIARALPGEEEKYATNAAKAFKAGLAAYNDPSRLASPQKQKDRKAASQDKPRRK